MSCLPLPQGKSDASPGCLELSGYVLLCSLAIFVSADCAENFSLSSVPFASHVLGAGFHVP